MKLPAASKTPMNECFKGFWMQCEFINDLLGMNCSALCLGKSFPRNRMVWMIFGFVVLLFEI